MTPLSARSPDANARALQSEPADLDIPRDVPSMNQALPSSKFSGRARGVLMNLVFTVAIQIVSVAGQLLTVPFYLRAWGDAVYGDWLTLSALSSYLSLSDMGMQQYVLNRLTEHHVRREKSQFDKTLRSGLLLYYALSSLALSVLLGLTLGLPWRHWFNGRAMSGLAVPATVVILGLSTIVLVWCGFFGGMFRVFGAAQKMTAIGLMQRVLVLAGTLAVLSAHRGPVFMAALQLVVPILFLAALVVVLKRGYTDLTFGISGATARSALALLGPSALFAVLALATGLTNQGTLLITSSLLGPVAVTGFATSRTAANAVRQVVSLLNNVAWPEFTRLGASGPSPGLSTAHRVLVKSGSLLAVWIVCSLWFTGFALYTIWTRGRARFDIWLFRLLLIDVLLQTPAWASSVLLVATNRHRSLTILYVIQGALVIVACPVAIKVFGIAGVGVVLASMNFLLFGFVVPVWVQRQLGERPGEYFREIYAKLLPIAAAAMATAWAFQHAGVTGPRGIVGAVLVTFLPVAVGAAWWLRPAEREFVLSLLRGRRQTKGPAL